MILDRTCGLTPQTVVAMQAQVLGFDPKTGLQELLPPGLVQSPFAMKGKISRDPDIPSLKESLNGPHAEPQLKDNEACSRARAKETEHLKAIPLLLHVSDQHVRIQY
jgi:hypothetical protein